MKNKAQYALEKEISEIKKLENRLAKAASKEKSGGILGAIESKIPDKIRVSLDLAFYKAFDLVLDKGHFIIEKTIEKNQIIQDQNVREFALRLKKGRKEWKTIHRSAGRSGLLNMTVSAVEGVGLGALGIGLPDIVLFLSSILRGVYEIALNYGFEYESRKEQYIILKMLETSLCTGDEWRENNTELDKLFEQESTEEITQEVFSQQLRATADAFAMDMLILKFIQGLPVVGIIGGAANPIYYKKVCDYAKVKYRKRFLLKHIKHESENGIISI